MINVEKVTIIGLGLIGGSIAKALKERLNINNIVGIDYHKGTLECALTEGIISSAYSDICTNIADSDIVFVCTPVGKTFEWVKKLASVVKPDCIITDVGSTKSQLLDSIEQIDLDFHFIGGHPMTGSEKSGFTASKSHLFENAYYILTPCSKSKSEDIETLNAIIKGVGGIPVELSSQLHDKVTGAISHVPHVISAALVNLVKASDTPDHSMQKLAAGGFKDITRISSSNPEMWHNICSSNKPAILNILNEYISILNYFKDILKSNSDSELYDFFNNAKAFRDSLTSEMTGLIPATYELVIDVIDRPGIIGKVASLLAENEINIKNINVNNSREFEGGVLIVSLSDKISRNNAYDILSKHGYKVVKRR